MAGPGNVGSIEITIANVVALLLPVPLDELEQIAAEHAQINAETAEDNPAKPFARAGAAASRAVMECRRALENVEPPAVVLDGVPLTTDEPPPAA